MAIGSKSTIVYMQSALAAAKTITNASTGSPGAGEVAVTSTSHGFTAGNIIKITGVGGMQEINSRAFVVSASPTGNVFRLKGTDPTYYTAYTSGGSAYKATMSAIGEVQSIGSIGGTEPSEIDVSHLLSVAEQKLAGLPKQSNVTFNVWFDLNTAMHTTLIAANSNLQDYVFQFYRPNSFNCTLVAQVAGFSITSGDVNSAYSASITLLPRGAVALSLDP